MMYDCIETLPDNVKAALDEKGQKVWMSAFNKIVKKSGSTKTYRDAVFAAWEVVKSYEGCRYFSGFVSTEDLDRQNDVVEVNKAFERIQKHVERGGTMVDTHTNRTVGSFIYVEKVKGRTGKEAIKAHSVIFQGEPYYDSVWDQIKKGIYCPTCSDVRKGFSIGGFALETKNSCDASGCHRDILDMSIHEISICQEPANPEALIQEVNLMAKSESDNVTENEKEISKVLRADEPASEEGPTGTAPVGTPAVPATPSVAAPSTNVAQQPAAASAGMADQAKNLAAQMKEMSATIKEMNKLQEAWAKIMQEMGGVGMAPPAESAGVAKAEGIVDVSKASCGCQNLDDKVHTSVTADKCPENKEVNGDVKDPQVRDSMKYLENKEIEAEPAVKKDHGELMPGKPEELKEIEFKDAKEGPAVETSTTKIPGFSKLEPKNAAANKDYKYELEPKKGTQNINDKGDEREENFGKEGEKDLMQKDCGCGEEAKTAEIPAELMPMFQEFLQEKGIKMEPEVDVPEIEEPMEKTLYVDDDISEMDLKDLSDGDVFDTAQMLGKTATQKLRLQMLDARLSLAKTLKVADIAYIVADEVLKSDLSKKN